MSAMRAFWETAGQKAEKPHAGACLPHNCFMTGMSVRIWRGTGILRFTGGPTHSCCRPGDAVLGERKASAEIC